MFFDPRVVTKQNFLMNFITSKRGCGKTFSTVKFCIEEFLEHGHQFVYIRRLDEEIKQTQPSLLANQQAEGYFQDKKFRSKSGFMYCDDKVMGRFVSISSAYKMKSVAFPNVKYIIFDEFISEGNKYLRDEVNKFLSVVESIGRMRDIVILCLANQSSIYNPYYIYWNLKPSPHSKGFTRFKDKSILLYEFNGNDYTEAKMKTKFGRLINGTEYGSFMLDNEAIEDNYDYVDPLKNCKKYAIFNMIIDGNNIVVYEAIMSDSFALFFKYQETNITLPIYNFDKILVEHASIESIKNLPYYKRISIALKHGKVRFDDVPVKRAIENYIFKC